MPIDHAHRPDTRGSFNTTLCLGLVGLLTMSALGAGLCIKVSPEHQSFVDQQGAPWFFCGDTQWELVRFYSVKDAKSILDKRLSQEFNAFLVINGQAARSGLDGIEAAQISVRPGE